MGLQIQHSSETFFLANINVCHILQNDLMCLEPSHVCSPLTPLVLNYTRPMVHSLQMPLITIVPWCLSVYNFDTSRHSIYNYTVSNSCMGHLLHIWLPQNAFCDTLVYGVWEKSLFIQLSINKISTCFLLIEPATRIISDLHPASIFSLDPISSTGLPFSLTEAE